MAFDRIISKWFSVPTQQTDDTANAADPSGTMGASYGGFPSIWLPGATGRYKNRTQAAFRQKWPHNTGVGYTQWNGGWIWGNGGYSTYSPAIAANPTPNGDGLKYKLIHRSAWDQGYFEAFGAGNYVNSTMLNTQCLFETECFIDFWTEAFANTTSQVGWRIVMTAFDARNPNTVTGWTPFGTGQDGFIKLDQVDIAYSRNNGANEQRCGVYLQGSIPNYPNIAISNQFMVGCVDIWVATLHGTQANAVHQPGCRLMDVQGWNTFYPEPTARAA